MKKKILLLVASALLVMLVLGCPNESSEPEAGPSATAEQIDAMRYLGADMWNSMSSGLEVEALIDLGILAVKPLATTDHEEWEKLYKAEFLKAVSPTGTVASAITKTVAEVYIDGAIDQTTNPDSATGTWGIVVASLQTAVTAGNTRGIITSGQRTSMNGLRADVAAARPLDSMGLYGVGVTGVNALNLQAYTDAFILANTDKATATTVMNDATTLGFDYYGTWKAVVAALQTVVTDTP